MQISLKVNVNYCKNHFHKWLQRKSIRKLKKIFQICVSSFVNFHPVSQIYRWELSARNTLRFHRRPVFQVKSAKRLEFLPESGELSLPSQVRSIFNCRMKNNIIFGWLERTLSFKESNQGLRFNPACSSLSFQPWKSGNWY